MTCRLVARRLAVCAVVLLALVTATVGGDAAVVGPDQNRPDDPASEGDVLVVDADGSAEYATVQAAVDAADPGDTVRVRPGTYRETVTVDENLTLAAPRGATLDGSDLADDAVGVEIERTAAPVVAGFAVVDFNVGVSARGSTDEWQLRDATIENASFVAVAAAGSDGDWVLENVTIRRVDTGVWAQSATGDWRAEDVTVRNVSGGDGLDALSTTGDWTLANVTVSDVEFAAVDASYASGDWTLTNGTLRDATVGVGAVEASGDWRIRRSTVANVSTTEGVRFWKPPLEQGVGVYTAETNGTWTVRGSRFVGNEAGDIRAPDANPAGDATRNYWGDANGAGDDDCTGNVDCSDPLTDWPPESSLEPPSTAPLTDTTPTTTPGAATATTAVETSASGDGGSVTAPETAAPTATANAGTASAEPTATARTTADTGPLSPALAVVGLSLGAVLAGRALPSVTRPSNRK
ncbi:right-handed parallel beta-helix repeat-containing protein [Halosimplex salinum]|uniref:right-handed parallel beta-helix repeat-containing protein n=1 Tax=Halosimplex salinum TaxID=1710538 RepID=UPI000F487E6E|nr:right-handed parallel beta-helix repeat-containing protein [Halosimplex salinum]